MAVITLTTDFGLADEYVGVMKGVILSIAPDVAIVDLCHHVVPFDPIGAVVILNASYGYFPKGSVHVAVVDPGVGTSRSIVAFRMDGHMFVVPDNGIAATIIHGKSVGQVIRVENERYFLTQVSSTFHGRDIFAPVAAHIANGVDIELLGRSMLSEDLVRISGNDVGPVVETDKVIGTVVSIDHFGNLITNIPVGALETLCAPDTFHRLSVSVGYQLIQGVSETYGSVPENEILALIGSKGVLEISVRCGHAAQVLGAGKRDRVVVSIA